MAHWVTPAAAMADGKQTALGEINYGIDSRMFLFAYRESDVHSNVTDTSIPAYNKLVALTSAERGQYADAKYLICEPNIKPEQNTTEVPLIVKNQGVEIDSGLRIASNGQIIGRLRISDAAKEIIFKVQYQDPPLYTIGVKYRAYSCVQTNGRIYRLRGSATLPYYAQDGAPNPDDWEDIAAYKPQYNTKSEARVFRIIINARTSTLITFNKGPLLGDIKIGEPLGEGQNINISATSSHGLSYELFDKHKNRVGVAAALNSSDNMYHQFPKGLIFESDGAISGSPIGPEGVYQFDVVASSTNGLAKQTTFRIKVSPGFNANTVEASLVPSQNIERDWYDMISENAFTTINFYRPSDPNFGLVDFPKLVLKRNIACKYQQSDIPFDVLRTFAHTKLASRPVITVRVGNMRYRTALDSNGTPLYDVIYKEIVPLSTSVVYSPNAKEQQLNQVSDILTLKTRLADLLGSDDLSVAGDKLRAFAISGNPITYDDLPLWKNNVLKQGQAYDGNYYAMPVAYVKPGEAERFIQLAIEYETLTTMFYNKIITFDKLVFTHHTQETHREIIVPLRST